MTYSDNIPKKEVARILNVSESTIVRWVNAGKFPPPYKIVGHTFFSRKEVLAFIEEKKNQRGFANPRIKK
jgi:excisionase family DNA binding protein